MGVITWVPLKGTSPMSWSILTVSALVVVQLRVVDSPKGMVDGSAKKVTSWDWRTVFFLTSMVTEPLGLPLRKIIKWLLDRSEISFSKTVSVPTRKLRIEMNLLLKMKNPPRIFLLGVFLVIIMTPSSGSSTVKWWKERWARHHLMVRSFGLNTI
ncbi:hypothetical protein ES703_92019 [subsurface metagenome]